MKTFLSTLYSSTYMMPVGLLTSLTKSSLRISLSSTLGGWSWAAIFST